MKINSYLILRLQMKLLRYSAIENTGRVKTDHFNIITHIHGFDEISNLVCWRTGKWPWHVNGESQPYSVGFTGIVKKFFSDKIQTISYSGLNT